MDRERPARVLAWALIALAVPHVAAAATSSAVTLSDLSSLERVPSPSAPLDLIVNGQVHDPVQIVLREGDALVAVEDLEAAGLQGLGGRRVTVDGRSCVSLASLAPALRFAVDEQALALRITADRELLARAALDLRPLARPPGLEVRGDASGFVNYSVQRSTEGVTSGSAEAAVSEGGRLLYSSGQLLPDGAAVRGLSSLTLDDVEGLRRVIVGDAFATSSALGGGVLVGGLSLVREYGLDPYVIRAPMPRLSGFASSPSTLDLYVNGVLTRQVPLPPGGYDVTNLPVTAGAGNVRTVLRDAYGRSEELSWEYYYTPTLLAPGLADYGYALGFRRLRFGRESFEYGRPLLVGRHRRGVTERLTLGGRLDAAEDLISGGPSVTVGLPFGTLDLEAAASASHGDLGAAASAGYGFSSRRFGAGALLRVLADRYAHGALRAEDDRARVQASVFAGAPLTKRLSVGLTWSLADRRDAGTSDTISLRWDFRLARRLTLGVTGSRSKGPGSSPAYEAFSILSWAYAPMSVANASVQGRRGGSTVNAGTHRGLPAGTGYGYRFEAGSGPAGDTGSGLVEYQWEHGRYELQYDRLDETGVGTATVAGGIAFLGGRPFLTRPVQDGYGLIRVGVPGIRGFAEGQEIGRTDGRGDLFVPRLLPYYGNRLGIADVDVPVEYQIGRTEVLGAPTLRGGVVTRFDVAPLRAVEGELIVAGREIAPAYGELRVRGGGAALSSPIGKDGRFYLESVPAGAHRADAEWSGGRCSATLIVPESPPVTDLGPVRCEPDGPAPVLVERAADPPAKVAAATEGPTTTPTPPQLAMVVPAPPAEQGAEASPTHPERPPLPVPPPRGFGPRTRRCPSCAVCVSAALHRLSTPTAQLRCVRDVTVMQPGLGRSGAARMCLATPDWDELCNDCVRMRTVRRCPTWPPDSGARRSPRSPPGRPGGRNRSAAVERAWEWSPFASEPGSWSMMSGFQDIPLTDRSP